MNLDWKDALGALKASGQLTEDNTADVPVENDVEKNDFPKATLHVLTDRKGRKGKTATIVEGFCGDDEELSEVAKMLKQKLGTGGSFRGGEILIQGDRKEEVCELLKKMGYNVK